MTKSMTKTHKFGLSWGSLYKQQKSKFWWVKYSDESGRQVRKSTRTANLGTAKNVVRLIEKQIKSARYHTNTLNDLVESFHAARAHQNTKQQYNSKGRLNAYLNDGIESTLDISRESIMRFLTTLKKGSLSISTVIGYKNAISAFCCYLVDIGELIDNPCHNIRMANPTQHPPRFLNDNEYNKALRIAREHGIYLQVLTALKTGMRSSEIRKLRWEHLIWSNVNQSLITVYKTEGKRGRTIPMHPHVAYEFQRIKKHHGPVFAGQRAEYIGDKQWRNMLKPLQDAIPKFTANHKGTGAAWHLLRHTFGYRMAMGGTPIPVLMVMMGHSSIQTTMIYARVSSDVWYDDIANA